MKLPPLRSLLAHPSAHYLLGEVIAKGVTFVAFIAIARWLGAAEFGLISLYVTLCGIMAVVVGAGLPNAVVRFHFSQASFAEVLGTTVVGLLGAFLALGGASAALAPWLAERLDIPLPLLWLAIPGGIAIALRTAWLASLRARKLSRTHARSQLLESALFALLTLLLLSAWRPDHRSVLAAYSGATLLVALGGVALWRRNPGLHVNRKLFSPLLAFALPMVFHAFAMTGLVTWDQIVLNQLVGPDATGTYAFAYRFGMSMLILSTAFSSAWIPEFLDLVRDPARHGEIRTRAHRYLDGMIAAAVVLMIALPPVVRRLGGADFAGADRLVPVVVYANLWFVLYTLVYPHAVHAGRSGPIAVASCAALLVNIALNYLLIPDFGPMGAALASIGGYVALFAFQLGAYRERIDIGLPGLALRVALVGLLPLALTTLFS